MKHVVMFSGGVGSWAAAKRVVERVSREDVVLLFTDTLVEDADLYRFLKQSAANLRLPITWLVEGRDIWQVFRDKRFLGNSRIDPCSRVLKRELAEAYMTEHFDPADTVRYVGIDWTEHHRLTRLQERIQPWRVEAPMCEPPYLSKVQILDWVRSEGIQPPRLYDMGFAHNNCGGFCVKAGKGHFAHLLKHLPDVYAYHEGKEQELRDYLGKDVSVMRDTDGSPLTMRAFRERIQSGAMQVDMFDVGGCGCFVN